MDLLGTETFLFVANVVSNVVSNMVEVTIEHAGGETTFTDFWLIEMRENLDGGRSALVDGNAYPKAEVTRVER